MQLSRLIYASNINRDEDMDIDQILRSSIENNKKKNITGALWFNGKFFLQVLEGGREVVSETYNDIISDNRHHSLILIDFSAVHQRSFDKWDMGYCGNVERINSQLIKYTPDGLFNPKIMSPESIIEMMKNVDLTQQ